MIDLDKQREAFEVVFRKILGAHGCQFDLDEDGNYEDRDTNCGWYIWLHLQPEIESLKAQLRELNDTVQHLKIESSGVHAALREQQRTNEDLLEKLFGVDAGEYVVVPKEPTLKMLKVADKHVMDCNATPESAYKAMIEAAQENSHE
ncbi:hypothetical protein [Acinetobacter soli]|uniref:hypothetical protein n=1 Tax=Acinetobacter soli TaxID=487316 RepID=UPI000E6AC7D4|nr:hypothetical protein [Acinetobacter soli]